MLDLRKGPIADLQDLEDWKEKKIEVEEIRIYREEKEIQKQQSI